MPTPSGHPAERKYADALQRAMLAIRNGRPAEALLLASEILKANAAHLEATKVVGYAFLMQDKPEEAAGVLDKVVRTTRDPEIEMQLAIALRNIGQPDQALIWLRRAVKRTPPFVPAFYELGCLLHFLKKSNEAIAIFLQAIAAAPMATELHLQLASVYGDIYDRPNARKALASALAINPRHPEAIYGLASTLILEGEYAKAGELFRTAIELNPQNMSARIGLATCLLELGQLGAAGACLRTAAAKGAPLDTVLGAILSSSRGRFWLRPSRALKFIKGE